MKVTEYCDALNLKILLTYYPNQNGRWCVSFDRCEIKDTPASGVLCSAHESGSTPEAAIAKYVDRIRGKTLVVDAMSDKRRVYFVPQSLEADMDAAVRGTSDSGAA